MSRAEYVAARMEAEPTRANIIEGVPVLMELIDRLAKTPGRISVDIPGTMVLQLDEGGVVELRTFPDQKLADGQLKFECKIVRPVGIVGFVVSHITNEAKTTGGTGPDGLQEAGYTIEIGVTVDGSSTEIQVPWNGVVKERHLDSSMGGPASNGMRAREFADVLRELEFNLAM